MFRFTIRELVLLTLVVALGVGWWVDQSALRSQLRSMRSELEEAQIAAVRFAEKLRTERERAKPEWPAEFRGFPGGQFPATFGPEKPLNHLSE